MDPEVFGDFSGDPQDAQPTQSGAFLLAETALRWQNAPLLGGKGNLKFGAWGHTGTFLRLEGGEQQGAEGCRICSSSSIQASGMPTPWWEPCASPFVFREAATGAVFGLSFVALAPGRASR